MDTAGVDIIYSAGYLQTAWSHLPVTADLPLSEVIRSTDPIFLESQQAWKERFPTMPDLATSGSLALLPLVVEGRAIGGLAVSFRQPQTFSAEDRALLLSLAQQCAQTLWRTQLYASERQARAEAEAARKQAVDTLESIADGFVSIDKEWRYRYLNRKATQLIYRSQDEVIGKVIWDVFPMLTDSPFSHAAHRVVAEQTMVEVEQFSRITNSWMQARMYPSEDGITMYLQDISARKRAEQRLRVLTDASAILASSLDYETTLRTVARMVVPDIADWCTVHVQQINGTVEQLAIAHADPAKLSWAADIQRRYPGDPKATTGLYQVIRSGESEFYPDITNDMVTAAARDDEMLAVLRSIHYSSLMIVPLVARGRVLGAIQLVSTDSGLHFTVEDLALAEDLARRAAVAIENARLYGEMRDQRERLQVTLSSIGDAVIATDAQGCITFMNPIAQTLTGWQQEEAIGKPLLDVFNVLNETSRQPVESPAVKVMRKGIIVGLANHTVLISKDGNEIPIDDSGAPILDDHGTVDGVILVFRDISARKHAEQRQDFLAQVTVTLSSSLDYETTLSSVVQLAAPLLADYCTVSVLEPDGSIRYVAGAHQDPAKAEKLQVSARQYPVRIDALHGTGRVIRTGQPELVQDAGSVLDGIAVDSDHLQVMQQAGIAAYMAVPLVGRTGILRAIVLTEAESNRRFTPSDLELVQELARRVALAIDNAHLYSQAQQAVKDRDEFLSVAAHELKTPVTSLRGFSQMLLRQFDKTGKFDPTQVQHALTIMDQQSVKLTALISQLLDLSRLQAGRLTLERQTVDLAQIIRDVSATMQRFTQRHTITVDAPPTILAYI